MVYIHKKTKWSHYRPGVAQRMGRGLALLFHDRDTRRGWEVSSTPRLHFTPGIDLLPIVQEAGWAPGPVWTGGKSRPHRDLIPDCPAHSQLLYQLSYPAHTYIHTHTHTHIHTYIFIPLIQPLHQLHLNMEHVNKHQTKQTHSQSRPKYYSRSSFTMEQLHAQGLF